MTEIIDRPRTLAPAIGRSEATQARYNEHWLQKSLSGDTSCDLCRTAEEKPRAIKIGGKTLELVEKHIALVDNDYPYVVYDGYEVFEHRMVVPKSHHAELKDFFPEEYAGYMGAMAIIMQEYDLTFTRSPQNNGSSIKGHLHTHAMKLGRRVEELSYSKNDGINLVRFKGEDWVHPL